MEKMILKFVEGWAEVRQEGIGGKVYATIPSETTIKDVGKILERIEKIVGMTPTVEVVSNFHEKELQLKLVGDFPPQHVKTVIYDQVFSHPAKYKYLAVDLDGQVWAFTHRPQWETETSADSAGSWCNVPYPHHVGQVDTSGKVVTYDNNYNFVPSYNANCYEAETGKFVAPAFEDSLTVNLELEQGSYQFEVPKTHKFVTVDSNGEAWAFSKEPEFHEGPRIWQSQFDSETCPAPVFLGPTEPIPNSGSMLIKLSQPILKG